ncbi:multiple sugar transport system permease protein [Meinhardsimonia xiamenensis]|jgi:multiple sugar transport system permease protein|uniref:Multiple sugar transport system permease protein n=1 Tax=Meinhardsimonia xiamenensis TaxID=990712 RepID=A0A1G8YCN4_9RHOB|nr:sugar ABC transporter permease [Meinhardsimonia xiamenensis]PRX37235.1 multiple sugar transport system permease protein [Meinhardsimonia xiamenensis]SDJ99995.1 multiple sugar transport system permease protein [Meinhardsimonia xiamenensis]
MSAGRHDMGDRLHVVFEDRIAPWRRRLGAVLVWGGAAVMVAVFALLALGRFGLIALDVPNWRPALYAYLAWAVAFCTAQVLTRGERGKRALFILPAVLFVVAMVVFPLIFAVAIALSDWNLSSLSGPRFNGLDNFRQMLSDPFYWNAMRNMLWYTGMISVEYVIAFGLALILAGQIRARKFFRVAFLLPLMLSPVAVSWMVGKSMLEVRFGPVARLARELGWERPSFFGDPLIARLTIEAMDAWTYIPFMMIMLLAGLQAIPRELTEAAEVDGASAWRRFWEVTFPLMLPVSITAILIRIIFKLKLADIIINVTSGGPGGATDSVTSFIFREYRDRSNVGYGTLLALVYLVVIVVAITVFMKLVDRWMNPRY